MASRSSPFYSSLHRPRLIMGIEKGSFAFLVMATTFAVVAKAFWAIPGMVILYLVARWLSKSDPQYVAILMRYLNESHVYDATPRPTDLTARPKGWGRGLPK